MITIFYQKCFNTNIINESPHGDDNEFYNNDELLLPDGFVSKEDYVEDYMEAYLLLQNALMVKDYQYNVTYLNLDYLKPKED